MHKRIQIMAGKNTVSLKMPYIIYVFLIEFAKILRGYHEVINENNIKYIYEWVYLQY
jgi:hypothetical protein